LFGARDVRRASAERQNRNQREGEPSLHKPTVREMGADCNTASSPAPRPGICPIPYSGTGCVGSRSQK
jgi:hypothetical protein